MRQPQERVRQAGVSVMEAMVALLLGAFVVHLGLSTVLSLQRQQERSSRRLEALLASRVASTVLRGELERGRPGRDWSVGPDSVALRAFRGTGVICELGLAAGEIAVAYVGDRLPDPAKDSVEIIDSEGSLAHFDLLDSKPLSRPCIVASTAEALLEWRVDGTVPSDAVVARVFEVGSYHLVGSALRYRIGAGGRQPLTPEVWRDAGTGLALSESAAVMTLEPLPGHGPPRSEFLVWLAR